VVGKKIYQAKAKYIVILMIAINLRLILKGLSEHGKYLSGDTIVAIGWNGTSDV
jgi:hypothetical protein